MNRIALTGRLAAWTAAGVIGAASVAGVATAATSSGSGSSTPTAAQASSASATTTTEPASDTIKNKDRRHPLLRRGLHGEFTAKTKDGYGQFATQRGSVTLVSGTSLTVRSEDGYTHAYTVNNDTRVRRGKDKVTIGDIKVGDKVAVVASADGDTLTALWVGERAK